MIPFDEAVVLDLLLESQTRLTVRQYIKKIKALLNISSKQAKQVVQSLVDRQELSYHYMYGSTYIEQSFSKPVQVTEHFTLVPPAIFFKPSKKQIPIILQQGISFGSGQHATTKMCLEFIDRFFFDSSLPETLNCKIGADIGTGSGILALAMCLSGLGCCRAYEIDPVSVNEAKKNMALNGLTNRISVIDEYITPQPGRFSIICANLRYPTLMRLSGLICDGLQQNGVLILSGIRPNETDDILAKYQTAGLASLWETEQNNWSGLVFKKQAAL